MNIRLGHLILIHFLLIFFHTQIIFSQPLTCLQLLEKNNFNTSRTLSDYSKMLTPIDRRLINIYSQLSDGSFIIDMGAGEALALKQIIAKFDHIGKAIAVGFKIPSEFQPPSVGAERFEYLQGDLLKIKKLTSYHGKIDLITDVYGPLSYVEKNFQQTLLKYLELLKVGGRLFFILREESNLILSADYPRSNWFNYFKSIQGIDVKLHSRPHSTEIYTSFEIIKTQDQVLTTSELVERKYEASAPPKRVFHWLKTPAHDHN